MGIKVTTSVGTEITIDKAFGWDITDRALHVADEEDIVIASFANGSWTWVEKV